MSAPRGLLRFFVHLYQGLSAGRPSGCRFVPSCSEYADEALAEHGAVRGSWLVLRRLSRCRPLGGRGFDPVPPASAPRVSTRGAASPPMSVSR